MKKDILKGILDLVILEPINWKMINCFILLRWLCFVVIDASPAAALSGGVPDLLPACSRIDIWGLSDVAKALCGTTCIKSQERPVYSCSRCAPGAGGGIGCALSGKRCNQPPSKRKQRLAFKKVFSFIHTHLYFKN